MKTLSTILLVLTAVVLMAVSSFAGPLPYMDYNSPTTAQTYTNVTGTATGYSVYSVNNTGSGIYNSLLLYRINVYNLNTSLDTVIFYDAYNYTDATANSRAILMEVAYTTGTSGLIIGNPTPGFTYVAPIVLMSGWNVVGDVGAVSDFTDRSGRPLRLKYGLTAYIGNPGSTGYNGTGTPAGQNMKASFTVYSNFQ